MRATWISDLDVASSTPVDHFEGDMLVARCLADAARGDVTAYFDLGVAFSTGSHGIACDLIEAHKWFNLAAVGMHNIARKSKTKSDTACFGIA